MSLNSNQYIITFAGAVCVFCSIFVSGTAVSLKERQTLNAKLDLQKNIISVADLSESSDVKGLNVEQINKVFTKSDSYIEKLYIDIDTGKVIPDLKEDTDKRIEQDKKDCLDRSKTKFTKKENKYLVEKC